MKIRLVINADEKCDLIDELRGIAFVIERMKIDKDIKKGGSIQPGIDSTWELFRDG